MGEATIGGGVIHRIKVGKNLQKSYCQTPFGQNSLILCGITIRCGFKGCLKRWFFGAKMGEANFYGKNRENLLKSSHKTFCQKS